MTQEALVESPVAEQLRRGFRWLRFRSGLEAAYRAEQFKSDLKFLRVSLAIVGVSLLTVFQIEHVVMPALGAALPNYLRFGVMVPILVLAFALTFMPRAETWYPRVMAVLMPVALMAVAWLGLWAWGLGENRLFLRLIIATIATYFLVGLPFRSALVASLIAAGFYAAAADVAAMPALELVNYLCMLFIANLMCAAGAYNMERMRRTAWLEARLLDEVAQRDGLTGLYNRRRFDEHLAHVWQHGVREHHSVTLLFVDIDHFKAFNDRYGHQAGDEAMKAVANALAQFARRPFDLVARYGGEEFAIVLHDTTQAHAVQTAEQLLEAVRGLGIPHLDSSAATVLTISVGVACVQPAARRSSAGLLQLADQALYAAKDGGRNRMHLLQQEYEHMKTGYFRRHADEAAETGEPKKNQ
jgi:diguanylate cyclase (GGDEF)-like protein